MPLSDVVVLLPCHSLDDFPVYHEGEDASELLAAWSVIWHPALLATTRKAPRWARADSPPENLAESLFVVPQVSEPLLPADWMARAEREAGGVVRSLADRRQLAARLLERLDRVPGESDPDLIADFWSLGTTYLLTELLTRQMRYLSNFDEVSLGLAAVRAAQKGVAGDSAGARTELRECFEILLEARERFYPVDCYLLDLTLVEPTTLGSTLAQELDSTAAVNLLATGETLCELAERDPETLGLLKRALEAETADVIGGEATSADLPLLSLEAMLWQCERGARLYEQSIGYRPQVWGRRRYGLAVGWPQVLNRWGFVAALHGALDAGQYPRGSQAKIRWEGFDGSAIDALARVPVDVRSDESILLFPARMGESMDLDHVATVMLAHWPGDASPFYEDLRRTARYVPVLGRFVTAQEYFRHTDAAGRLTRFEADQYRTPYLKEAVAAGQADPLSRYVRHLEAEQWLACCATFDTWTASLRGVVASHHELVERVGKQMPPAVMTREPELWTALRATLQSSAQALAERLGAGTLLATTQREVLVLNPLATSRDVVVSWPDSSGEQARGTVPGCGFAWLRAEAPPPPKLPRRFGRAPEQASHLLSNGQMRVRVDEQTGGIRSVHGPARFRGNRLTQQIAFRLPTPPPRPGDIWRDPDEMAVYSTMVADSIEDVGLGSWRPKVVSRGRLLHPEGQVLARFEQQVCLPAAGGTLEIEMDLQVERPPVGDPWDSYFAARFAWPDEEAVVSRSVHGIAQATTAKRVEAPLFVDVEMGQSHTTLLTAGLPLHRRVGPRMLDTLLHVTGETQQRFRLGLAIDASNPTAAGLEWASPVVALFDRSCPPGAARSGWLFRWGARNVVATHWEPIVVDDKAVGIRLRLLETLGRSGRVDMHCFRPVAAARQTDFQGQTLVELPHQDDAVPVDFAALEWVQLEIYWAD